jgi:methionyl-tRNA formyltransferase
MAESHKQRLIFAGTPQFAAQHLQALVDLPLELVAVYTQPDRPAGRGKKLSASPVKQIAESLGLPVYQPLSLRDHAAQAEMAALRPDLLVVVAYGLILPQAVLDIPRFGCINVHASLLPRWRGAAPIQRAIEAGDEITGISIMQMDAGLDTGPVLADIEIPIAADTTAGELLDRLAEVGAPLLAQVLHNLPGHLAGAQPQNDQTASYAHKLEKAEAQLDWTLTASVLERQVLAFNPFPVAWSLLGPQRLKIWRAHRCDGSGPAGTILRADETGLVVACGEQALCITTLQLPGGKAQPVKALLNSRRELFAPGNSLSS